MPLIASGGSLALLREPAVRREPVWRLAKRLDDIFPGSQHVVGLGLSRAPDESIWDRAKAEGWVIVSKDDDFRQRAFLYGAPPKTIWVRQGNASTDAIEVAIRREADAIRAFIAAPEEAMLIVGRPS